MSEQPPPIQLPTGGIAPGRHHMHPAFVILNAIRIIMVLIAFTFFSFISSGSYEALADNIRGINTMLLALITLVLFLVAVGITVLASYIYYRRFLWEITDSDVHIYSGIFFKKQVHIPFQRVQSIDFNAPLLERILGIVRLKIETAGGAHNRGVFIPALKLAEAEALRAEVFARKKYSSELQEAAFRQKVQATREEMSGQAAQSVITPRFDPQTRQPLPAQAQSMPQFDPLTGLPLPLVAPTSADRFVSEVGTGIGNMRGVFADSYLENAPVEYEYGLTAKELIFSAISGDHNLILSISVFLIPILINLISLVSESGSTQFEYYSSDALGGFLSSQTTSAIILSVILFLIFTIAMGVIGTAISFGGFKASRRGGRIEVERGLISRQYRGVAINRVQSVEINQGFIRRLLGYVELKLLTIDALSPNQNKQNSQNMQRSRGLVIHPFVKKDRVEEILSKLIPEFNERPVTSELKRLPKVALRRVINRHAIFFVLLYGLIATIVTIVLQINAAEITAEANFWLTLTLWSLLVFVFIGRFIASILWYRQAAYTYNKTMLMIHQGFFSLTTTIIPRQKIQWAQIRQNPFQRWAKVSSITAVTAAGIGGTRTRLRDVCVEDAIAYLEWIRPRG